MGTIQGPITAEQIAQVGQAVRGRLATIAREQRIPEAVFRDILPATDLNSISGEIWQQDVSTLGYAMNYSGTNPDDRAFVIFGARFLGAASRTAAIRFFDGTGRTRIKDIWQVEQGQANEGVIVLAEPDSMIEYLPSLGFNLDFYGDSAGIDNVALLGKVVEPRGKTVAPKG